MGATSTAAVVVSYSVGKGRDTDPQAAILGVKYGIILSENILDFN